MEATITREGPAGRGEDAGKEYMVLFPRKVGAWGFLCCKRLLCCAVSHKMGKWFFAVLEDYMCGAVAVVL